MSELRRADAALTEQDKTDIRRDLGLGTAAVANVPASGNAASGEVVKGNDTRLSDPRTPTTHSHTAAQVTDFAAAADARIAAASVNALADIDVTSPSVGQVLKWNGAAWVNDTDDTASGGGATNLSYTPSPTGGTVHSDTGADATVPLSDGTNAGLLAPAQHAKLAGVAANATANSSDATLLARANHTGTQAASTISDFSAAADARISAAVSVTVASAAQGTDAREWTAATVDQAEAEAGAATTRRAWTAQRVAQAIAAQVATWWTSISTAAGRALVTAADAAAQRTALGLGTAATTAASAYATSAQGVPAGGATGQVLAKTSATDYAVAWTTASGGDSRSTTLTFTDSITPATLVQWQYAGYGLGSNANGETLVRINNSNRVWMGNTGVRVRGDVANSGFAWSTAEDMLSGTVLAIVRDADNVAAQRNGTNAQERRTYGTYTDASNYRRLSHGMSTAGVAHIRPEGAGTGSSGNVLHISGLPTSNPGPGILWNDAGTVKVGT